MCAAHMRYNYGSQDTGKDMAVVRALYSLALQFDTQNAALLNNYASLLAQLGELEAAEKQVC